MNLSGLGTRLGILGILGSSFFMAPYGISFSSRLLSTLGF